MSCKPGKNIRVAVSAVAILWLFVSCAHTPETAAESLRLAMTEDPETNVSFEIRRVQRYTGVRLHRGWTAYSAVEASPYLIPSEPPMDPDNEGLLQGVPYTIHVRFASAGSGGPEYVVLSQLPEARVLSSETIRYREEHQDFFLRPAGARAADQVTVELEMPDWWPEDAPSSLSAAVAPWELYGERAVVVDATYLQRGQPVLAVGLWGGAVEVFLDRYESERDPSLVELGFRIDCCGPFDFGESEHSLVLPEHGRFIVYAPGGDGPDADTPYYSDSPPDASNVSPPVVTSGPGAPGEPGGWGGRVTVRYTEAVGRELAETMVPADRMYLVGGEGGAGGRGGIIWHRQERVQEGGVVFYYTNEGRSSDGPHGESGRDGSVTYFSADSRPD